MFEEDYNMGSIIGVLVFPAGEINSIELHDALSTCVNIKLYGASSIDRHGEFVFKNYISNVPKINEPDFLINFNHIIVDNNIDVVIPTHDDVALFFAKNRDNINASILTSDINTTEICRDKKKIYELFSDSDFNPIIYDKISSFPVFIKPRKGQGGIGSKLLTCDADVPGNIDWTEYVICEYLPGVELTVDCFTDKNGNLQAILPRSRQRVFGGVSVQAQNEPLTEEIKNIANTINARLKILGLWYFQIKKDSIGRYKLEEISVRCAGTMCLSRALGVNLPLLSVYEAMGRETSVFIGDYNVMVDRTLISRYKTDLKYNTVYIDFDDTIIINGKVNLKAMHFLYQCINNNKSIFLITRHSADHNDSVIEALYHHKISLEMFTDIIELDFDTPKHKIIDPAGAIFIDNAFYERKSVRENLHIPVFDVDGIEVLLDWRS